MRRSWRNLGLALAVLAVLIVGAIVFVERFALDLDATRKFANRRPDRLQMSWTTARMPELGRLEIDGFRISGQTRSVQWSLQAGHVSARLDLRALVARHLQVSTLTATGVDVQVRRTARSAEQPGRFGLLPPTFPEFDGHPFVVASPAPGVRLAPRWRLDFAEVQLEGLREIWIEDLRYAGSATAHGGFEFRLGDQFQLLESEIAFVGPGHRVNLGDEAYFSDLTGRLAGHIDPYAPRELRGWDVLQQVTAHGDLTAISEGIDLLRSTLAGPAPWLEISGRHGVHLTAKVALEKGRWRAPSRIAAGSGALEAKAFGYAATGDGQWSWSIEAAPLEHARVDAHLAGVEIRKPPREKPYMEDARLEFVAVGEQLDGLEPFRNLVPRALDLRDAKVGDISVYNADLPPASRLRLRSGTARAEAHIEPLPGHAEDLRGTFRLAGKRIRADAEGIDLVGDFRLDAAFPRIDWRKMEFGVAGTELRVDQVSIHTPSTEQSAAATQPWWGRTRIERGWVRPGKPTFLEVRAEIHLADSRPLVLFLEERRPLPGFVRKALIVPDVAAQGTVRFATSEVRLLDFSAEGGERLEFKANLVRRNDQPLDGIFFGRYRGFSVGMALRDGKRDLKLIRARQWFESQPVP
jgi:hypothetical protein